MVVVVLFALVKHQQHDAPPLSPRQKSAPSSSSLAQAHPAAAAYVSNHVTAREREEFRATLASQNFLDGAMPKAALFAKALSPESWAKAMMTAFVLSLGLPRADAEAHIAHNEAEGEAEQDAEWA